MPNLEAGFFFIILGLAFVFSFVSFKMIKEAQLGLRLLAMVLFIILSMFIGGGYSVAYTSNSTLTSERTGEIWTESDQQTLIEGGESSSWLAWVFAGLTFMNFFFVVREMDLGAKH